MVYSHRNLAYDLTLFEEPYEDEYQIHNRLKNKKDERSAPQNKEELKVEENKKEHEQKKQKAKIAKRKKGNIMKIAMAFIFGVNSSFPCPPRLIISESNVSQVSTTCIISLRY